MNDHNHHQGGWVVTRGGSNKFPSEVINYFYLLQVKRDMVAIKHELDTVQQVKEEIEELREYVDRLEEHTHRRKLRLMEQVSENSLFADRIL